MNEKLKVMDDHYLPQEAKDILITFLSSKINFYQLRNLSSQERFGKEDVGAIKRIPELKQNVETLLEIISDAKLKNKKLSIIGMIDISYSDD